MGGEQIIKGETLCRSSLKRSRGVPKRVRTGRTSGEIKLTVPLIVSGSIIGAVSFAPARERHWTPDVINGCRRLARVRANALARKTPRMNGAADGRATRSCAIGSQRNVTARHEIKRGMQRAEITGTARCTRPQQIDQVAPPPPRLLRVRTRTAGAHSQRDPRAQPRARPAMVRVNWRRHSRAG